MTSVRTPLALMLATTFLANGVVVVSTAEASARPAGAAGLSAAAAYRAPKPQPFPERSVPAGQRLSAERVREMTGLRGPNAKTYELADGRLETEVSAGPVHYRDSKGAWRDIDLTIGECRRAGVRQGQRDTRSPACAARGPTGWSASSSAGAMWSWVCPALRMTSRRPWTGRR